MRDVRVRILVEKLFIIILTFSIFHIFCGSAFCEKKEEKNEKRNKYSLSINPFSIFGINFEYRLSDKISLNSEINWLVIPFSFELGTRFYFSKTFKDFYLYSGGEVCLIPKYTLQSRYTLHIFPDFSLILSAGYKYFKNGGGWTADPFLGVRFAFWAPDECWRYEFFDISKIGSGCLYSLPVLGLYLGYTW